MAERDDICAACGRPTEPRLLDAKPSSLAGRPASAADLSAAAARGEDFDVMECRDCYGPGFTPADHGQNRKEDSA